MLLDVLDEHRGAFEYDWRNRLHIGATAIGHEMSWSEAVRMVEVLVSDPSSMLGAALAGWQYPLTRAELALRDLYDLQHRSKSKKKPKPYPRPWDAKPKRIGAGTSVTIAEYEAIKANLEPKQLRDSRGRFVKAP